MKIYDKPEFRKRCSLLKGEYKDCMDKIENYCKICFCGSQDDEEDCVNQMLGEVIQAQNCLEPISMLLKTNLKNYCNDHIKQYQSPNARLIKTVNQVLMYATFIVLIMFIQQLRNTLNPTLACMYFGPIEMIVVLYAFVWSGFRIFITKQIAKHNKVIKNLDMFVNIGFIAILFPIYSYGSQLFILQVPTISLMILLVGLVLIKVYVVKSDKKENSTNEK